MSSFWGSLFAHLKDCGRNASLFIIALAGLFLVLIIAAVAYDAGLAKHFERLLPIATVLAGAWLVSTLRRIRQRRRERVRIGKLSSDELRVARTKLLRYKGRFRAGTGREEAARAGRSVVRLTGNCYG